MSTRFSLKRNRPPGRKLAQAMLEFALVLPILLLIVFGVIEFARLFYAWILIENATRFGVRYATTGNFDYAYCTDLNGNGTACGQQDDEAEVDAARIPSIKDETRRVIIGLRKDESLPNTAVEYLKITVCSSRPTNDDPPQDRVFTPPRMGQPVYADCAPGGEDAGGPGDTVVVAADYNFTFIVLPVFGIQPSMIHLASYREGTVEQFRISRVVNTPRALVIPTHDTFTPEPSDTPVPTDTQVPTLTPSFTFTPSETPSPTITLTPTQTLTPTVTPQPSCSRIRINRTRFNRDEFQARVQNDNVQTAYLINSTLSWDRTYSPPMFLNYFSFNPIYFDTDTFTSPITAAAPSLPLPPGGSATAISWIANFDKQTFVGLYTVSLTFEFPGWGTCVLTSTIANYSPTPSFTPTITRTPTKTLSPTITRTPSKTLTPSKTRTPRPATSTPTKGPAPTNAPTNTPRPTLPPTNTRPPVTPNTPIPRTPTPRPTLCPDC